MNPKGAFSVSVFIEAPEGIPFVLDHEHRQSFWKLPGGRSEEGEDDIATGIREVEEEVGLKLVRSQLKYLDYEQRAGHVFVLYEAKLPSLVGLKLRGDDGEDVRVFSRAELAALPNMLGSHRYFLEKHGKLPCTLPAPAAPIP